MMLTKQDFKYWIRSGSYDFMRNNRLESSSPQIAKYVWRNNPIYYRPGTFDPSIIYNILLRRGKKGEYWIREKINPKIIFDIGGNIGIAAIYFTTVYPDAQIYSFEPVPENYKLLSQNVAPYKNVKAFPFGLGIKDEITKIYTPSEKENKGGFTCFPEDDTDNGFNIEIKYIQSVIDELGINKIDLIKIDTEGYEYDILTNINPLILQEVDSIIGELHDNKDYELLRYLSQYFRLGFHKNSNQKEFMFNALKK